MTNESDNDEMRGIIVIYKAADGKEFFTKEEAVNHMKLFLDVESFVFSYADYEMTRDELVTWLVNYYKSLYHLLSAHVSQKGTDKIDDHTRKAIDKVLKKTAIHEGSHQS